MSTGKMSQRSVMGTRSFNQSKGFEEQNAMATAGSRMSGGVQSPFHQTAGSMGMTVQNTANSKGKLASLDDMIR